MIRRFTNYQNLINYNSAINQDLKFWIFSSPRWYGINKAIDLCNKYHGVFGSADTVFPSYDSSNIRPGGYCSIKIDSINDSYVEIPFQDTLSDKNFAIQFWVYALARLETAGSFLFGKSDALNDTDIDVSGNSSSDILIKIRNQSFIVPFDYNIKTWFNFAITKSNNDFFVYKNGILVYRGIVTSTDTVSAVNLLIGGSGKVSGPDPRMKFDDFSLIYGRCPTESEIFARYSRSLLGYQSELNWKRHIYDIIPETPATPQIVMMRRNIFLPWLEVAQSR
jgi:hypothetical protein